MAGLAGSSSRASVPAAASRLTRALRPRPSPAAPPTPRLLRLHPRPAPAAWLSTSSSLRADAEVPPSTDATSPADDPPPSSSIDDSSVEPDDDDPRSRRRKESKDDLFGGFEDSLRKEDTVTAKEWLEGAGKRYRNPTPGRPNWLGGDVPFPLNPWFKPPPPLSDALREKIYESFKARVSKLPSFPPPRRERPPTSDGRSWSSEEKASRSKERAERAEAREAAHEARWRQREEAERARSPEVQERLIRETSQQWGVSIPRVEAVVRLKALEHARHDPQPPSSSSAKPSTSQPPPPLEIHFEKGMESYLGVEQRIVRQRETDPDEMEKRKEERRRQFLGIEFVELDADEPSDAEKVVSEVGEEKVVRKRYEETEKASSQRQIIGPDGLPRPSAFYIARKGGHVPMAFRDVSEFPRARPSEDKDKAKGNGKRVTRRPLRR